MPTRNLTIHLEHEISCRGRNPIACFTKELRFYSAVGSAAEARINSREPGANYGLLGADLKAPSFFPSFSWPVRTDRAHPWVYLIVSPSFLSRSKRTQELERATFDTFAAWLTPAALIMFPTDGLIADNATEPKAGMKGSRPLWRSTRCHRRSCFSKRDQRLCLRAKQPNGSEWKLVTERSFGETGNPCRSVESPDVKKDLNGFS